MEKRDWATEVRTLLASARKDLGQAVGLPTDLAAQLHHRSMTTLMECIELFNDNFQHKVDSDGTKTKDA